MANVGDYWIMGYRNAETQPAKTFLTGSTCIVADDFGDAGNLTKTNGIVMFSTPKIDSGGSQTIFAKASSGINNPKPGGGTANIGFYMSEDETLEAAEALANYILTDIEGAEAEASLQLACVSLASSGYWNSYNTNIAPFS